MAKAERRFLRSDRSKRARRTRSGSGGGVLDPGEHEISHNCGGAGVDAEMEWTLTIGG